MLQKKLLAIALCVIGFADAQIQWPAITQQSKPWARWWWQGSSVNARDITSNMEDYKAAGLGGLEVTPIYGVYGYEKEFINFLSPQWMQMLGHTLKEGKRLGLGIDIANGTGWPFGGPWITDKDASKTVVYKSYSLSAGEQLKEAIEYKQESFVRTANNKQVDISKINPVIGANVNLQELALDQVKFPVLLPLKLVMAYSDKGAVINVTSQVDANGKLNWKVPEGRWTLYALFESLHGKMVERAAPGGEGYAIDHFSAEALQTFLKRFDTAFKGHDISGIRALFNDSYEVDDARGQSNWTPKLFEEFEKRRGYDLRRHLPALFKKADEETNSRIIYDYRSTIDELILEYFTKAWKKWSDSKGAIIRNQSHGSPANLLDLYGAIDIPETEGNDIPRFKFATSAGNVMGKPLISSESATWLNEHFLSSWGDVKKTLDLFWLGGVNHIFYHGVNYSPKAETFPGWLFYAAVHFQQTNPQWKDFHALNSYVARTQAFLQKGKPDNDVLMFYPLADRYQEPGANLLQHFDNMEHEFNGTDFQKLSEWMLANGHTFDFFSDRQLQNISLVNNKLVTGGNNYQTILLPANKYMSEKSFEKLVALARAGAKILVYKKLPQDVPGYYKLKERQATFQKLMDQLQFAEGVGIVKATIGKGTFLVSDDMDALLKAAGVTKEKMVEKGLQFVRRKNADGYTYFINNRTSKAIDEWIVTGRKASAAAMFNALTAASGLAEYRTLNSNGLLEVHVQLQPSEAVIVQTYNTTKTGAKYNYIQPDGKLQTLSNDWAVSFISGGPALPANLTVDKLQSWTENDGEAYQAFSGTAKYTTTFALPAMHAKNYQLNLGKVHETAEVLLNGKPIATLIGPNFTVVIPGTAFKSTNTLEVIVSNLMANRITYMDKNNLPWKKFYNTNMPARRRENAKNGLFDASNWEPLPSGLLGPVSLQPLK